MRVLLELTVYNAEGADIKVKFESEDPGSITIMQSEDNVYVRAALVDDLLTAIMEGRTKAKSLTKAFAEPAE